MMRDLLKIVLLQCAFLFGSFLSPATTVLSTGVTAPQGRGGGFKVHEPNVYAPHLFADKLDFVATLVRLPGAEKKQSYWELSYQLFFIPEDKYDEALKRAPRGPSNPTPEEFPGRILLAEGHKKKMRVGTPNERTITLTGVPFKTKVPDAQRTKFSYLMTAFSLKIFDAQLNTTVYKSGVFLREPFESSNDQNQVGARKTIYVSFGVNPDGTLNYSQLAPHAKIR